MHCGFFSRYFVKLYFEHVILTCFIIITTFELSTTKAFSKVENIFDPIRLTHKINEKTLVLVFLLKVKSISRARAKQNISQILKTYSMGRPELCGFLIYQIIKFKMLIKYYCFSKKNMLQGKVVSTVFRVKQIIACLKE